MGLDLFPIGRPKPGDEAEWERLVAPFFAGGETMDEAKKRIHEIAIQPYEAVGAPRVGMDAAATEWMSGKWKPESGKTLEEFLAKHRGFYVLRLVEDCDGLPRYSNCEHHPDLDETSFRGQFLSDCRDVLGDELTMRAWDNMRAAEAAAYGAALLAVAERQSLARGIQLRAEKRGPGSEIIGGPAIMLRETENSVRVESQWEPADVESRIDVIWSAGRWYVFWGQRGHPIEAWY